MNFGERIRFLRNAKNLNQRELAAKIGVNFTYLSKIENGKLDFAQFPSEGTINKLASALEADEVELLLLARKIPDAIRKQVIRRPDLFRKMLQLDEKGFDKLDRTLDELLKALDSQGKVKKAAKQRGRR